VDRWLVGGLLVARPPVWCVDRPEQNESWSSGNLFVHTCARFDSCICTLEIPQHKVLETDVADLRTLLRFHWLVYISLWRTERHGTEPHVFVLGSPLADTFCNQWPP
jgi:hypothetical protein